MEIKPDEYYVDDYKKTFTWSIWMTKWDLQMSPTRADPDVDGGNWAAKTVYILEFPGFGTRY